MSWWNLHEDELDEEEVVLAPVTALERGCCIVVSVAESYAPCSASGRARGSSQWRPFLRCSPSSSPRRARSSRETQPVVPAQRLVLLGGSLHAAGTAILTSRGNLAVGSPSLLAARQ